MMAFIIYTSFSVYSSSPSAAGVCEDCQSSISPADSEEQSSMMPQPPKHASRHHVPALDQSLAAGQHDGLSECSNEQTPVKVVTDRLAGVSDNGGISPKSEKSFNTPAGVAVKSFASPVSASPANTGVLAPTNTRRIGSKFCIDLVKGWSSHIHRLMTIFQVVLGSQSPVILFLSILIYRPQFVIHYHHHHHHHIKFVTCHM